MYSVQCTHYTMYKVQCTHYKMYSVHTTQVTNLPFNSLQIQLETFLSYNGSEDSLFPTIFLKLDNPSFILSSPGRFFIYCNTVETELELLNTGICKDDIIRVT